MTARAHSRDCLVYEYRPNTLYVNLTNRCTNECLFCARSGGEYRLGCFDLRLAAEHPAADYLSALEPRFARASLPREVVFCGYGEPTLRIDALIEIAGWVRSRGVPVRLNTNGQAELIHRTDVVSMLAACVDRVNVSLNAPDGASYLRVSNPVAGEESWRWVVGFLRRAVRSLPEAWASVVGEALTAEEVSAARELAGFCGTRLLVR
ncbi:MAG: TatD family nuclease-associated radical SAM protein [Candidatus Eisenbacteria bacterium]|nr:TatD family nuclease-associated radical SAM protein [Candidatus Eisenbacteria bacterium]